MFGIGQPRDQLVLVPFDLPGRDELFEWLIPNLSLVLQVDVEVGAGFGLCNDCYDVARGQYNAHLLVERLQVVSDEKYVLGITAVDLYAPVFKFVIGEALLDKRTAVLSTYRLAPQLYGLPVDLELLRERVLKEAVHELGHCVGLVHCFEPKCAMRAAGSVEDIDLREFELCAECADSLSRR